MSVDYNVAVHQAHWPTSAALQSCLADLKYPVVLAEAKPEALRLVRGGLPVRFQNRVVDLEASIVQLSPTEFHGYWFDRPPDESQTAPDGGRVDLYAMQPDEVLKGRDINDDLAALGVKDVSFGNGDYVLTLSFRSAADEIRAGLYLMAAIIKCFGGYGFEFQSETHGQAAFADGLVADAANEKNWK